MLVPRRQNQLTTRRNASGRRRANLVRAAQIAGQVVRHPIAQSIGRNALRRLKQSMTSPAPQQVMQAPVAQSMTRRTMTPRLTTIPGGGIRVTHAERIATVRSSSNFTVGTCAIQPGLNGCFAWLAAIAGRYETYTIHSLKYEYRTKTSTDTRGNVILSVDYDALEDVPTDGIQAEAYKGSMSGAPWQNFDLVCAKSDLLKRTPKYVRTGDPPPTADLKSYDVGNLHICVEDFQTDGDLLGYVYVHYDIQFTTPQLSRITTPVGQLLGGQIALALNDNAPLSGATLPSGTSGVSITSPVSFSVPPGWWHITTSITWQAESNVINSVTVFPTAGSYTLGGSVSWHGAQILDSDIVPQESGSFCKFSCTTETTVTFILYQLTGGIGVATGAVLNVSHMPANSFV